MPPYTWADLLRLVCAVRRLAFDTSLPPAEAMGRIRDAFRDYDQQGASNEQRKPIECGLPGHAIPLTRCRFSCKHHYSPDGSTRANV